MDSHERGEHICIYIYRKRERERERERESARQTKQRGGGYERCNEREIYIYGDRVAYICTPTYAETSTTHT